MIETIGKSTSTNNAYSSSPKESGKPTNTTQEASSCDLFCCFEDPSIIEGEKKTLEKLNFPTIAHNYTTAELEKLSKEEKALIKTDIYKLIGINGNPQKLEEAFKDIKTTRPLFGRKSDEYKEISKDYNYAGDNIKIICRYKRVQNPFPENPDYDLLKISIKGDKKYSSTLNITFDLEGSPLRISQWDDPFNGIGVLINDLGFNKLSSKLSTAKKEDISFFNCLKKSYDNSKGKITKIYNPEEIPKEKKLIFVPVAVGKTSDIRTPIGTNSLSPCAAFIIVDKKGGRHHMTHVNGVFGDSLKNVNKALDDFDLKNCSFHLVLGVSSSRIPKGLFNLLTEKRKVTPSQITIYPPRKINSFHRSEDVIIHDGNFYRISEYQHEYAPYRGNDTIIEMKRQWDAHLKELKAKKETKD